MNYEQLSHELATVKIQKANLEGKVKRLELKLQRVRDYILRVVDREEEVLHSHVKKAGQL